MPLPVTVAYERRDFLAAFGELIALAQDQEPTPLRLRLMLWLTRLAHSAIVTAEAGHIIASDGGAYCPVCGTRTAVTEWVCIYCAGLRDHQHGWERTHQHWRNMAPTQRDERIAVWVRMRPALDRMDACSAEYAPGEFVAQEPEPTVCGPEGTILDPWGGRLV